MSGTTLNMIKRYLQEEVVKRLKHYPATGIIGARQTGKTTLAKQIPPLIDKEVIYLDLEPISGYQKLENPVFRQSQTLGVVTR